MGRVNRVSRADQIADVFRDRIRDGVYESDTYLPGERELASDVGASRATVAQALAKLACEGVGERVRGRGTRVLPPDDAAIQGVVAVVSMIPNLGIVRECMSVTRGIRHALSRASVRHEDLALVPASHPRAPTRRRYRRPTRRLIARRPLPAGESTDAGQ